MIAYVAHIGRPQQSITNGMYQYIGIRMAQQALLMFQAYAAQPKFTPFYQTMDIETKTNPYIHCEEIDIMLCCSKSQRTWKSSTFSLPKYPCKCCPTLTGPTPAGVPVKSRSPIFNVIKRLA